MSRQAGKWPPLQRLLLHLNPMAWLRRRHDQALHCALPCILDHAVGRWIENPGGTVELSRADYALIKRSVGAEHGARGLKYVGPFCSWRAVLEFVKTQVDEHRLLYAVPGRDEKVWVRMTPTPGERVSVSFEPAPGEDWSLEGVATRWERVTAVPRSRHCPG
jgi:hypothetical protein